MGQASWSIQFRTVRSAASYLGRVNSGHLWHFIFQNSQTYYNDYLKNGCSLSIVLKNSKYAESTSLRNRDRFIQINSSLN